MTPTPVPPSDMPSHKLAFRPVSRGGKVRALEGIGRLGGSDADRVLIVAHPTNVDDLLAPWTIEEKITVSNPDVLSQSWTREQISAADLQSVMSYKIADIDYAIKHPEVQGTSLSFEDFLALELFSPWGVPDQVTVLRLDPDTGKPDILSVATPSHGGLILTGQAQRAMPECLRLGSSSFGAYEEDSDWSRVATVFPELFTPGNRLNAEKTLRNFEPDAWENFYKIELLPGQSLTHDTCAFRQRHADDLIVVSACMDPNGSGDVLVSAVPGENRRLMGGRSQKNFLVPADEYQKGQIDPVSGRNLGLFVIDPEVHQEYQPEAPSYPAP